MAVEVKEYRKLYLAIKNHYCQTLQLVAQYEGFNVTDRYRHHVTVAMVMLFNELTRSLDPILLLLALVF